MSDTTENKVLIPVEINGASFELTETTHKKGKAANKLAYFLELGLEAAGYLKLASAVGTPNFWRTVYTKVIRPACNDATAEAISEETGKVDEAKWVATFISTFQPHSRRSGGPTLSELREQQQELMPEMTRLFKLKQSGQISPADDARFLNVFVEFSTLADAIEKKSRKGKAHPAAAEPVAA